MLLLIWVLPSSAQNNQNFQKMKPLELKLDKSKQDSLKAFKIPLFDSLSSTIEIPNAYKGKKLNLQQTPNQGAMDDSVILEKKLTGSESVMMPGTKKLGNNSQKDKFESKDVLNSLIQKLFQKYINKKASC